MGLYSLTLDARLAKNWRSVLETNGLTVSHDDSEESITNEDTAHKRVIEEPWLISNKNAKVRILQVTYRDQPDGSTHLIFMPMNAAEDRQLFQATKKVLVAAGAAVGVKRDRANPQ
jgi:hypothetical protein